MAAVANSFKNELKIECLDGEGLEMDVADQLEEGEISDAEDAMPAEEALFEPELSNKQAAPSKRFDLIGDLSLAVPQDELKSLYGSLGIDEENERHYRFNTIHMRGTGTMNTKDVYEYFSGLEPSNVEWLDEGACNIEWDDEILPARALLYLSVEIKHLEKRFKVESGLMDYESDGEVDLNGDSVDACKLKFFIPPGRWRKGVSCESSKDILMRYANKDDKKVVIADSKNDRRHKHRHSSKYGKKSRHKEIIAVDDTAPPKNPWGALAQSWGRGEGVEQLRYPAAEPRLRPDLRTSLNDIMEDRIVDTYLLRAVERRRALPPSPLYSSSGEESGNDDDGRRRKLPRMRADHEEERQKIKKFSTVKGDLRQRLNHRKFVAARGSKSSFNGPLEESDDDLSSDWAVENYKDLRSTVAGTREREDMEESESELELGDDEPGELLQIEIDNDRFCAGKKHKH